MGLQLKCVYFRRSLSTTIDASFYLIFISKQMLANKSSNKLITDKNHLLQISLIEPTDKLKMNKSLIEISLQVF